MDEKAHFLNFSTSGPYVSCLSAKESLRSRPVARCVLRLLVSPDSVGLVLRRFGGVSITFLAGWGSFSCTARVPYLKRSYDFGLFL